jgi:hypothetical protein
MELCKYCKKKEAIKNSHIIPASIYDWLKKTSATGYLRSSHEPNLRRQDGIKKPLLCTDCEVKFSKYEDFFTKHYFIKVANYRKPCPEKLKITKTILGCLYIIAWRVLANTYYFPEENDYTDEEINMFPNFLADIKKSIDTENFSNFRTHIIPCTKKVLTNTKLPKLDWHVYERSITAEPRIWDNLERFIIYIQIPFSIIVFEVVQNNNDSWKGTQVEGLDVLTLSDIKSVPGYLSSLIKHYHSKFLESNSELSEVQQEKMKLDLKNADPNCGSFKSGRKSW